MAQFFTSGDGQMLYDNVAAIFRDGIDEFEHVVHLESVQYFCHSLVRDRFEDFGKEFRGQLPQHRRGSLMFEEEVDDYADLIRGEVTEKGAEIGGVNPLEEFLGSEMSSGLQKAPKDSSRDDGLGHS
jgi:hypothetical protein